MAVGIKKLKAEPVLRSRALLGEGAIWDTDNEVLHWVDIEGFKMNTFNPDDKSNKSIDVKEHIGTVVKRSNTDDGEFLVALPGKFVSVDQKGNQNILGTVDEPNSVRMNDGKCDPAGRFWCGSMAFDFTARAGNLWMMDTNLKIHHKLDKVTISNGLVWTADSKTMYYIDTPTGQIDAFDFELETGEIKNRRIVYKHEMSGYLDGMTIDTEDNLYVATWEGSAVYKINPKTGSVISIIEVPGASRITSCAFGGPNLEDLYITSSAQDTDPEKEPNAGALFRAKIKDACGVPAFEFKG